MILGKKNSLKYSLNVGSITNKESDEVEVLEMTIDIVLNLTNISKIYCTTNFML